MKGSLQCFMENGGKSSHPQEPYWFVPQNWTRCSQNIRCSQTTSTCAEVGCSDMVSKQIEDDSQTIHTKGLEDMYVHPSEGLPDPRLAGRHFMIRTESRRRCKLCMYSEDRGSGAYESKISLACDTCNVFLHFECFQEYHERVHPISQWAGGTR